MPTNKDLKRRVRRRMQKTGESYTAARVQVLKKNQAPKKKTTRKATAQTVAKKTSGGTTHSSSPSDDAALAGTSDKSVQEKTGKTWKQWVKALDRAKAHRMSHRDIARHISEHFDVSAWWSQTLTVGYERIKGLRDVGQRGDGSFSANKSKTFPVAVMDLYEAFATAKGRARWLADAGLKPRKCTRPKYARFVAEDGTTIEAVFTAKGSSKSQVAVQHNKLPSAADIAKRKEFWAERFAALSKALKD